MNPNMFDVKKIPTSTSDTPNPDSLVSYETPNDNSSLFLEALYFSSTTQTTLGYGDLTPSNPFAKVATSVQSVFGLACYSFLFALLFYKVLHPFKNGFVFDNFVELNLNNTDIEKSQIKIRFYSRYRIPLFRVNLALYIRFWDNKNKRYLNRDISITRKFIPILPPMRIWNITGFLTGKPSNNAELSFDEINEEILSCDEDEFSLVLFVDGEASDIGTKFTSFKEYKFKDIRCGTYKSVHLENDNERWKLFNWSNWNRIAAPTDTKCHVCKIKERIGLLCFHNAKAEKG